MKKSFPLAFSLAFSLAFTSALPAQQVYRSADYGGQGTIYLYNRLAGFNQDTSITQAGADVTWDLSTAVDLNTHASEIVSPDQGIDFFTFLTICALGGHTIIECSSTWSNTQQAWVLQDSISLFDFVLQDLKRFQRKTNNYLLENFIGFNVDLGGINQGAVIVYNKPDTILHFPIVYGDQYTSNTNWALDLSATGQNIQYQSQQNRTTSIDAWGTLVTPYQTFTDVVRMRSVIERQDSITTDSFSLPINISQIEYMWFDTLYKLPVMLANGVITDTTEVLGTIEYLYESVCETPTWSISIDSVQYVLDANGAVTVVFTVNDNNADEFTWDWGNGEVEVTTGTASHTFTEPGIITVGVQGCMTNCLPLNSCMSEIIDFEILVSTPPVPGEDAGIRLYPNPVQETMQIVIPDHLGALDVTIIEMSGKVWSKSILNSGLNTMSAADMPAGMYTLKAEGYASGASYYIRFVIK
jgi:hypothetical protein